MSGFFSRKQVESTARPMGKSLSCASCGLYKDVESPKMKPFGNFKKGIMNIGDFPNELDDSKNALWQGKEGRLIKRQYEKLGIDLFEDCINISAANCHTKEKPTNHQLDCCRSVKVLKAIEEYKPKLIVLFGQLAVYSLIGHRWKKDLGSIDKWRGWCIPDQDFKAWVCPVFNPNYLLHEDKDEIENIWKRDIKRALSLYNTPFPVWKEPVIEVIDDLSAIEYKVFHTDTFGGTKVRATPVLAAFDYETTGLKPHGKAHKIICASIADSEDHVYVFMMPETRKELKPFINFLSNPKIGKIAQNMKYEHVWTKIKLKTEVQNWEWDTMIAAHVLDNRPDITGLKFQNYVNFGIVDYDSDVAPYLRPKATTSANDINQIEDLLNIPGGKEKLLKYCAYDSINEYRLAMKQMKLIIPKPF